ncbi:SRPBCC domain-containing protein [Actinosynnema sp. NPDC050801]|uniref:SRPBCC family protein n=1 Tax=unclassified Actinosynnema TaxID=2637065 RepID=UPI0033E271AF
MTEQQPEPLVDESTSIAKPAADVWRAITVAELRAGWWGDLDLDATVGGRFEEPWTDGDGREVLTSGTVTEVVPDQLLVLSWADEDWPATTRVEVRLTENGGTTSVRLRHSGWGALPGGEALAAEHRAGWRLHLNNLRTYVERTARD